MFVSIRTMSISSPTRIPCSRDCVTRRRFTTTREYDFFALSRFADVNRAVIDHGTYSSARGVILELIKANLEIPSGMLIFEDPPIHDVHRKLLSRMFTRARSPRSSR